MTNPVGLTIVDTGMELIAHHDYVIYAVAREYVLTWSVWLRNGDSHTRSSTRDAMLARLQGLRVLPVAGGDVCDDLTCCLTCGHGGDDHDAGDCWHGAGVAQCPCFWEVTAGIRHRHIEPAVEVAS